MNKIWLFGAAMCLVLGMGSCKPKQSAYKAAYEKAKEKEVEEMIEVEDVEEEPVVVAKPKTSNATVQKEKVTPVFGEELKQFSVVVGSFMNKTNALSLKQRMEDAGYNVVIAQNEKGMYRVIVATFDNKADAAEARDQIKRKFSPNFQDAWILERQY